MVGDGRRCGRVGSRPARPRCRQACALSGRAASTAGCSPGDRRRDADERAPWRRSGPAPTSDGALVASGRRARGRRRQSRDRGRDGRDVRVPLRRARIRRARRRARGGRRRGRGRSRRRARGGRRRSRGRSRRRGRQGQRRQLADDRARLDAPVLVLVARSIELERPHVPRARRTPWAAPSGPPPLALSQYADWARCPPQARRTALPVDLKRTRKSAVLLPFGEPAWVGPWMAVMVPPQIVSRRGAAEYVLGAADGRARWLGRGRTGRRSSMTMASTGTSTRSRRPSRRRSCRPRS